MSQNQMTDTRLIDVYPYRLDGGHPKFLLLRRSADVIYAGQWRMVGGKVNPDETSVQAAFREFSEETSMVPINAWVLPTVNAFYDPKADQIRYIAAFAFECGSDQIRLNHEHDAFEWLTVEMAIQRLGWHEQRRILQIAHDIITSNSVLPEWQLSV